MAGGIVPQEMPNTARFATEDFTMSTQRRGCAALALIVLGFSGPALAAADDAAALTAAARAGNWDKVLSLVAVGTKQEDVNGSDGDGTRPLHWAVRADELEVAATLLKAGADVNARNRLGVTPVSLAAANGNGAMLRRLFDHGANPNHVEGTGETLLMTATRSGSVDAVRAILDRNVNPNAAGPQLQLTALMIAAGMGSTDVVRALIVLLENHQRADGSIELPAALRPYAGFDRIGPR
jgi:ankyrin repeat protein